MLISQNSSFSPHMCVCLLWQGGLVWLPWKRSSKWPQFSGSKTGLFSKPAAMLSNVMLGVTRTGSEIWNTVVSNSLKLFPVARQTHSHWGDTSANHLAQLHCSEPCHAGFWVSPKTETSQLLWMTSSSTDDPHSGKKCRAFFFLWFALFLSYT